ncbi:MAG: Glu/Leu/Phe/Val dehydrogenase dimerization domain-containing protein [Candidatus Sericytochromatia bacterium]
MDSQTNPPKVISINADDIAGQFQLFDEMALRGHEQIVHFSDESVGLKAIVAIHSTILGPALGGTRMWPYESETEALQDVMRLSRGMTYKAAVTGLNLGGGKAVIIGDPKKHKSEALFRTFGRFVESLGGRYITAEDVGINVDDMEYVRMETRHVTGLSRAIGGSGDPSPITARGVFYGMKACANEVYGSDSLRGKRVTIQGLGHVGKALAKLLAEEGAEMLITDLDLPQTERFAAGLNGKARVIAPDEVFKVEADIFSPSALGGVINNDSLNNFGYRIIAGSANNQLADELIHGEALKRQGVLYAPDYVINAGGLINVWNELQGYNEKKAIKEVRGIYDTLQKIFAIARKEDLPTNIASNRLAERRIAQLSKLSHIHIPGHSVR